MKLFIFILLSILITTSYNAGAQNITYSEVERADGRNLNFEILGNFSNNFLVYKNLNKRQELTIYDNEMIIKETVDLDFISDRATNIDFVTYPDFFIMVWQFQKGNTVYCKAAKMSGSGKLIGNVLDMDTTKENLFSNNVSYTLTWSEDKKKILLYKIQTRNDLFNLVTKVYDENFALLDSSKTVIDYNDRRESFGTLSIDNEGTYLFTRTKQNARPEYINTIDINFKKLKIDSFYKVNVPLKDRLIQDPFIKIDNLNSRYILNSFSYQKNGGNIDGLLTAVIRRADYAVTANVINVFQDSLRQKLSGKPEYRTAYNNLNLRNIILKKDGGFIALTEEYYKQRRFGNSFDDRFYRNNFNTRYYSSLTDYYYFNRGYYGYYRPFNDAGSRDIVYNYNDIVALSFSPDLKLQWNNVINKTTSDVENDNYLSFANMNAGAEIHFLFLQKDNNRQILSNHALQPGGSLVRYATLKSREAGFNFMPRLARQTAPRQMIVPCIVRNNIAFAKIDF